MRSFWGGVAVTFVGIWVYHHFLPGKGIGQPGTAGG
jgi:hypothetical protein